MILSFRNKSLRNTCEAISDFNDAEVLKTIEALRNELIKIDGKGIGLSANQIGVNKAISVLLFPESFVDEDKCLNGRREYVLLNPRITGVDEEMTMNEGCLSIPNIYANIPRYYRCNVENYKIDGSSEEIEAHGILAQALQHEIDHLNGKLFIDHLDKAQKIIYENRLRKIK